MKTPNQTFCILPWVSLEASPIGTVRPCCLALDEVENDAGEKYRLQTASFDEIQNSQQMRKLREDFLAGKKPQTCKRCWNEERSGRTSKRMHTLDRLKHIVTDTEWTTDAKPLVFLDLKLGNICNLKCRICGSWSSSQYAAEDLQFTGRDEDPKKTLAYTMLKEGAWPRESPEFWAQVDKSLFNIRYLEFTGGEPFLIQEHFDLLKRLVESGHAGNIEIHYNTNGTVYPDNAEEIWQHFKHVEIAVSIDDVGDRFEYQRSNAIWDVVEHNVERFVAIRARHSNISLQVCTTVNLFNVMYLADVARWIDTQDFDFVYWNMLHEPFYFSIATMPKKAKDLATLRLRSANVSDKTMNEFENIIRFMENGNTIDSSEILHVRLRDMDFKRRQSLREVAPELADAINYQA